MINSVRLIKWCWRAWPVIIIGFILCVHLISMYYFPHKSNSINKIYSLVLQIFGGLLVLYSIDSNIGIIKNNNILYLILEYFKDFPVANKTRNLKCKIVCKSSTGRVMATNTRNPIFIEEKIEYLQEQINDLRSNLDSESKYLEGVIKSEIKEVKEQMEEGKSVLVGLETKIDKITVGGVKVQVFGVMLMIYGSITSYLV